MAAGAGPGVATRVLGARVKRLEDPALLAGQGRYLDDIGLPGMLHAAFVRSPHAHARVTDVDALHSFLMDRFSARREIVGFRSSVIYQHVRKPVVEPLA